MKIVLAVFLLIVSFNSHSQVYNAGYMLPAYFDVNPDTLINYGPCSSSISTTESYYFDVNGDSQNDFQIKALCAIGLGGSNRYITITSLNPGSYIRFGRLDSVYDGGTAWWWVTKISQPLQYGDSINSTISKWDSTGLYFTDNSSTLGTFKYVTDWVDTTDKYIGIKYQDTTDTIYGWIRVNCPYLNNCYIKDYSLAGGGLGIKDFELNSTNIYPNPTIGKFVVQTDLKITVIEIYNVLGEQIAISDKQTANSTVSPNGLSLMPVDLSSQPEGIYFVRIQTAEGMMSKKMVVVK